MRKIEADVEHWIIHLVRNPFHKVRFRVARTEEERKQLPKLEMQDFYSELKAAHPVLREQDIPVNQAIEIARATYTRIRQLEWKRGTGEMEKLVERTLTRPAPEESTLKLLDEVIRESYQ